MKGRGEGRAIITSHLANDLVRHKLRIYIIRVRKGRQGNSLEYEDT